LLVVQLDNAGRRTTEERKAPDSMVPLTSPNFPPLPHPPRRLPVFDDLLAVRIGKPAQSLTRWAVDLGPLFEVQSLGIRYVVAAGAEVIRDLNDESRFEKHLGPEIDALRAIGGDGLFTARTGEPNWFAAHELLMPAFSQSAMRRYHDDMLDVTSGLIARWDAAAGKRTVDVPADTTRVTLETVVRCSAGYTFDLFSTKTTHPHVRHMVAALKRAGLLGMLRASSLPQFVGRPVERSLRRHGTHWAKVADEIIAARWAADADEDSPVREDLLQLMLGSNLDIANIRYQLINFLIAGHETTSGALSFALYYLGREPGMFARARAEIDEVWGDTDRPSFENVAKLRYVRRVFDEALRLHPPVPGYYRAARADTVLAGIHPMQKGDWALALTSSLHRDPQWGPHPDRFDPDRFEPQRVRERQSGLYKPFGTGDRSCIGRQFALHEAVLLLASIIRRYDLIVDPGYRLRVLERPTLLPRRFRLGLRRR
jgi:cytochrome P450